MKTTFIVVAILATVLSGCADPNLVYWTKTGPNRNFNDFNQVRYKCLKDSQVTVQHASQGRYDSYPQTNDNLFTACMNANDWFVRS